MYVCSHQLRSSDPVTCAVRRTRTSYGDRCFAVAGPRVWNSLPTDLRQSDSLGQFKRRLKTPIRLVYGTTAPGDFIIISAIEMFLLTYVLNITEHYQASVGLGGFVSTSRLSNQMYKL